MVSRSSFNVIKDCNSLAGRSKSAADRDREFGRASDQLTDNQRLLALLPVAGAKLIALQRIENAQDLIGIAANRALRHVNETDHIVRVDDECRALRDAGRRVENTQLLTEVALDVREHWERQVPQVFVMIPPCMVHPLRVDAYTQDLRIT